DEIQKLRHRSGSGELRSLRSCAPRQLKNQTGHTRRTRRDRLAASVRTRLRIKSGLSVGREMIRSRVLIQEHGGGSAEQEVYALGMVYHLDLDHVEVGPP